MLQPVGQLGNLGRTTGSGPGLVNLDMALLKSTPVKRISDVFNLQFRAEFFNILNHPNWQWSFGLTDLLRLRAFGAAN